MKPSTLMVVVIGATLVPLVGKGDVITFDSLPGPGVFTPVPNGYGGLNWNNFYYANGVSGAGAIGGYVNAVVSPNNVAYNGNGNPGVASDNSFTLNSGYFTAAWNDGLQIQVKGYVGGVGGSLVDTVTFTVNTSGPTLETFGWANIDTVQFISSGGTPNPNYVGIGTGGTHFAMDNLNVTLGAVPEPSTFALLAAGAISLLAYRWRRRKAA